MLGWLRKPAVDRLIAQGDQAEKEGRLPEAVACFEKVLSLDPAHAHAAYNLARLCSALASALVAQGKLTDAAAQLEALLERKPDDFGALYSYAGVVRALGRLADAKRVLQRALAIDSGSVEARAMLCDVLDAGSELDAAAEELERLLVQRPDWADAHYKHGCVLQKLVRLEQAAEAFRRAIRCNPGHAEAYRALGGVLLGQGHGAEALALYRKARQACPEDFGLESAELFALNASSDIEEEALFARHVAFGARLERAFAARFAPFRNARDPQRRLRIGYVSGDFCYHVVTLFMLPVLERHDRGGYQVFCYSTGGRGDDYTRKAAGRADVWRDAAALSPEELARQIHADGIDVLVDLGGHSGASQLPVFAQQPAPVQVTWLGYLNTTGLTRIGYRITDRHADPPGAAESRHTERLVRLPHAQWCYRPFVAAPAAPTPPCARNGYVTFGSFNQTLKLSPATRALWARILAGARDARLVVLGVPPGAAQADLRRDLAAAGAAAERIALLPYVSLEEYFRWLNAVDIALDTTPYSGGTTTLDALWMGVPVLTAPGARPGSRSAASILATAGLAGWIMPDATAYLERATALAADPGPLASLRGSLRERLQASPLMDEAGFTKDLENAYRQMWRQYCQGA